MQKSPAVPRWWDWFSIVLLFFMLEVVASRLVGTDWTDFLFLAQTVTYIGYVIGTILGYTRFSPWASRGISFLYMLILLPLQWTLVMDQSTSLEEQLLSVGGRLYYSLEDFFARRSVDDTILFITLITIAFWIISTSAGFRLVRYQSFLAAVLPSTIALLVIQSYNNISGWQIWVFAIYAFLALLLLGRLHYLENKKTWHDRRIFLSIDNSLDLTSTMAIAAGLIILIAWTPPASKAGVDSAIRTWDRITSPWREFTDRMENAVSALESPVGGKRGEFFGSQMQLGRGFPLSDMVMFHVRVPELPTEQKPPRYYWRGRTYDFYKDGGWFTTGTELVDYSPADTTPPSIPFSKNAPTHFIFNTGETSISLVYAPSQTIWFSRQGAIRVIPTDDDQEVVSWYASPTLMSGEIYQVDAVLSNPNVQQLREAGTNYPAWVTDKYLQLPADFSPAITELAGKIAAEHDNPYDKAFAITTYLREKIEYEGKLPTIPRKKDPLEWMLFEYKKAYCVYYSSADILMLRSLGIPARMAVGFSQGERDGNDYIVRKNNAHAWPEVYFPGIGWVEFEPTGSQPTLTRPLPPRDGENNAADFNLTNDELSIREDLRGLPQEGDLAIPEQVEAVQPIRPIRYLIPLFIIFTALMVFFSRRYSVHERLPVLLRATYERSGTHTPNWVINWEHWVNASSIERSFESINFGLHILDKSMPMDATPAERAMKLKQIMPKMENEIKTLLDEHQTSLYTSRQADAIRARNAAFKIRLTAATERIRRIFEGKPVESP